MKNFLKTSLRVVAYFGVLVMLLLTVSQIVIPKNNRLENGIEDLRANGFLSEKENSIDVLILGDSESYTAFIPMQLWEEHGFTSYCCGTSGQSLNTTEGYLIKCFDKQSPRIVILETDAIYRSFSLESAIIQKVNKYFPVFFYHDRWKSLKADDFLSKSNYTYVNDEKGYSFSNAVDGASDKDYMKSDERVQKIPVLCYEYVKSIKAKCDEHSAKLILISTPSTKNWNMANHNGIEKLAKELDVEYIDMNLMREEIPINWKKDTRDKGDHLNYFGAVKVTSYLGKFLSEKRLLTDHRNDSDYDGWYISLEKFKKTVSG